MSQSGSTSFPIREVPRQSATSGSETRAKDARVAAAGDERLEALTMLLSNPDFRASERNRRFLKFVVEEAVAGRSSRIKAFTIAVDVFGRDADFDASLDPIVRIAAGQLRKSLREYYEGPGRADPIRINLPLGAYVPSFEKKRSFIARRWERLRNAGARWGWPVAVFAMAIAAASVSVSAFLVTTSAIKPQSSWSRPVIVLDSARSNTDDPAARSFARSLTEALWVQMGRYGTVRIVGVRPEEELSSIVSRARETFGDGSQLFKLHTSVQREGAEMRVYWHLVDANSRETYYSSMVRETITKDGPHPSIEALAGEVAESLFSHGGIMNEDGSRPSIFANDLSG